MAEQTLLNLSRPPIFCPGCSHDKVLRMLDKALVGMGLQGSEVCIVTDIGCSGFFDVFFDTHAFHGVHGRALTYATGIKLGRPELNVVVTMGDGGLGIGGAHVISACRRNLDITLLVLNNFNFGMTGGQCSATTPNEAVVASGFLNKLDKPLDLVSLAIAAGAPFACRCSAYQNDLVEILERAVNFKGFSVVEIQGICPGRYTKDNKITARTIAEQLTSQQHVCGEVEANTRTEFGVAYRREAALQPVAQRPQPIEVCNEPLGAGRQEVVILGAAGQRIISAGEILVIAGLTAGLHVSQKNEYNVTVLRGPSISELILSPDPIDYNGSTTPSSVIALADEGVARRAELVAGLAPDALMLSAPGLNLPHTEAEVRQVDLKTMGIKRPDWALASLAVMTKMRRVISADMLNDALNIRFQGDTLKTVKKMLEQIYSWPLW
jgi:2-oxoglutarate ferredoxin oxidoreductase subunit beta